MRRKISQAEARQTARELKALRSTVDDMRRAFSSDYPGTWLARLDTAPIDILSILKTAYKLDHSVVVKPNGDRVEFYAVPNAKQA